MIYSKTYLKRLLTIKTKTWFGFKDRLSLNAGQKYCRIEHSAILLTFIKLPFVIKIFVLYILEWPLKTDFTVSDPILVYLTSRYFVLCTNMK